MKLPNQKQKNSNNVEPNIARGKPTSGVIASRYRNLIVSIALFLSLIGALLAYTFYTSSTLQANTSLINTSNRVANDTQSVIKDLFDMQNSYGEDPSSPHMITVLKRLKDNSANIDKNIALMETGGSATDADGRSVTLPTITDATTLQLLEETKQQWQLLKPKITDYLAGASDIMKDSAIPLSMAGEQAKTSSLSMNESLRNLTDATFEQAKTQANTIRYIQLLGVTAILGYFAIFIFFFVRRLRTSDEEAQAAQRETQDIMENVSTGLFLLDKDLNIGNQYSAQLANIIGSDKIAGENLTSLLKSKVTEKDLETTQGFVKQLYNPRVKEKLINDLNPLKKVMVQDDKNRGQNRFLDFKFSRVFNNNQIAKILVNVQDVTPQVRLEQRLELERAQNDLQVEMLTTILNVSPALIGDFIRNTKENIVKVNNILKSPGSQQHELEDKLNRMYRIMHSLKGEASALNLHSFTNIATNFEEKLKGLQNQDKLAGNNFLPLTIHLDELLNLSNTIEALGKRINQTPQAQNVPQHTPADTTPLHRIAPTSQEIVGFSEPTPATDSITQPNTALDFAAQASQPTAIVQPTPISGMDAFYQQFADNIALRQHKQVTLKSTGFDDIVLPRPIETGLKEIVIQLIRNSVVHGIEAPEQRQTAGKPATGHIKLSLIELSDSYKLNIEDDGQGIDYNGIKRRAVEMGYNAEEMEQWAKQKLTTLLFESGFSTSKQTDEDSGRGVGMDIIKERVQELRGQLSLDSKEGLFTRFAIKIPKNSMAE